MSLRRIPNHTNLLRRRSNRGIALSPELVERFALVCRSEVGKPMVLPPPTRGRIRILTHSFGAPGADMARITALAYDRTIAEWLILLEHWKNQDKLFPMFTSRTDELENIFYKNQRFRFFCRTLLLRFRTSRLRRREIGCPDLYTTLPIPNSAKIYVHDYPSQSVYLFHTNTAIQMLNSGILYSSYGIATPHIPKNPYTNLEWNLGQIIGIVGQICKNIAETHRFPPIWMSRFRAKGYSISRFKQEYSKELHCVAAEQYFKNLHDPDVLEIYRETTDDLLDMIPNLPVCMRRPVRKLVIIRTPPKHIMAEWDDMIVTGFLYQNCGLFRGGIHNLKELVSRVLALLHKTLLWWRSQTREIRTRSRIAAAAAAAAAAAPPQNELQMGYQVAPVVHPNGVEIDID